MASRKPRHGDRVTTEGVEYMFVSSSAGKLKRWRYPQWVKLHAASAGALDPLVQAVVQARWDQANIHGSPGRSWAKLDGKAVDLGL